MKNNKWSEREESLRNALKAMRKSAGLSQSLLAQKLDKPQSFVSKYESGERQLRILELEQVCIACGTTAHHFLKMFSGLQPLTL
ncbi:Cro/Cl family transcriptional regulator [Shewanella colwelliana]|uniref:Cro/Cl family transcriptional regulator n=1 Tax=Shewanella colwelliana TaxID=23 RepID=A0A1E5IYE3_SHECO|nr:helix-turn-helix transcriptional regulator [Shewanella colwelliana]OEG75168.1 Cro/Cl family transcriptional regulator [Shewanella colwelliana]